MKLCSKDYESCRTKPSKVIEGATCFGSMVSHLLWSSGGHLLKYLGAQGPYDSLALGERVFSMGSCGWT